MEKIVLISCLIESVELIDFYRVRTLHLFNYLMLYVISPDI